MSAERKTETNTKLKFHDRSGVTFQTIQGEAMSAQLHFHFESITKVRLLLLHINRHPSDIQLTFRLYTQACISQTVKEFSYHLHFFNDSFPATKAMRLR